MKHPAVAAGLSLAAAILGNPAVAQSAGDTPVAERTRLLITRYFEEVWNRGQLAVLDEIMAPDYINHSPSTPDPRPGPEDLKPIVSAMRAGIPDLHYDILDMVVTPTKAAVYLRVTGTHSGSLFGIAPTGKSIDVRQMQIEWLRDGRIWQHWRVTDELGLLRQLGVVP
jgi:ketosteroid isomerase-like protein